MSGRSTATLLTIAVLAAQPAHAQSVEEFYKGRRITVTVGYGPGGGYDVFARLLARHIGKYIPAIRRLSCRTCPAPEAWLR
jgi:tripartite-type tricarboxylate transporter receptor subunit TctC